MIDAYALLLGSLLILSGSTGDWLGRRRTFQMGLAIFTAGSLLCSLAPTAGRLIGFRMVQGVGGSMLNPVSLSIIRNVFTDDRARARAMGVWAGVFGLSFATGPLVGGLLIGASAGWRSIFWVNVPVGVAALTLTPRFVHESRAARPRRLDPGGQVLVIAMLASLTYAIIEGPQVGWTAPLILAAFTLALLALTGVVIDEFPPQRAAPGAALLQERALLGGNSDRPLCLRGHGRLRPDHDPLPTSRPGVLGAARRPALPARSSGGDDLRLARRLLLRLRDRLRHGQRSHQRHRAP